MTFIGPNDETASQKTICELLESDLSDAILNAKSESKLGFAQSRQKFELIALFNFKN